jgi:hypothetical protein
VFEDEDLVVVDKPAGLVVHPGAGNPSGTLVNALLARGISGGEDPSRPGVVHRLDRDTSGLMVVAKGEPAYSRLVGMMSRREVGRVYRAVVVGTGLPETGTVDSPVGRDPDNPTLMAAGVGKEAVTHFEKLAEAAGHTMLRVRLGDGEDAPDPGPPLRHRPTPSTPTPSTGRPNPDAGSGSTPRSSSSGTRPPASSKSSRRRSRRTSSAPRPP